MTLRIHHLQHVAFEGLGSMEPVLREKAHKLTSTHFHSGQRPPAVSDFDWLIVMGGPMGVYDEQPFPWLLQEKALIRQAIDAGKVVLGICLGAQLIAEVLGAKIYKNHDKEIGWFPIERASESMATILGDVLPATLEVFHWHGDTFDIPRGAKLLASSEACRNQGFILDDRVVALQFHLETTPDTAAVLIENCRHELDASRYVQTETEMLSMPSRFTRINDVMRAVLEKLE